MSDRSTDQPNFVVGGASDAKLYANQIADLYESDFFAPEIRAKQLNTFDKNQFKAKLVNDDSELPNFRLVTTWLGQELLGFAFAASLPTGSLWWSAVTDVLPDGFNVENGHRTLALFDIAVKEHNRRKGIASKMHHMILENRPEERATLFSSKEFQPAYSIFQRWGYEPISAAQFTRGESQREVFVLPLKIDKNL